MSRPWNTLKVLVSNLNLKTDTCLGYSKRIQSRTENLKVYLLPRADYVVPTRFLKSDLLVDYLLYPQLSRSVPVSFYRLRQS